MVKKAYSINFVIQTSVTTGVLFLVRGWEAPLCRMIYTLFQAEGEKAESSSCLCWFSVAQSNPYPKGYVLEWIFWFPSIVFTTDTILPLMCMCVRVCLHFLSTPGAVHFGTHAGDVGKASSKIGSTSPFFKLFFIFTKYLLPSFILYWVY